MSITPVHRPAPSTIRLFAFVLVVALFFTVARSSVEPGPLLSVFALYLVVATLWVRGLDESLTRGIKADPSLKVMVGAACVPLVATAVSIVMADSFSSLLLGLVLTAYLVAGFVIRGLRTWLRLDEPPERGLRIWVWRVVNSRKTLRFCVALVLAILVLGLVLLGRVPWQWAVILIGSVLVVLPGLAQLLAEHMTKSVSDPKHEQRLLMWGTLMVLPVVVAAVVIPQSVYPAAGLGVLLLLVFALTAGSLADVAAALAVIALLGVTAPSSETPDIMTGEGDAVLVAIGDSYLSGEGANSYIEGTNEGGVNQCRRAPTAWPVLAASRMNAFERLVFVACSGAQTVNIREPDGRTPTTNQQYDEGQQITSAVDQLNGLDPSLVVVSIGGNDAGFADVGITCLAPRDCDAAEPTRLWQGGNLERVRNRLRQTYDQVRETFENSPVVVVPYPDPIEGDTGCEEAPLGEGDITFIRDFLDKLNGMIKDEAQRQGFYYAHEMRSALAEAHLQLCNKEREAPGLNFLDFRSVAGLAGERFNPINWKHNSLHPNERGHAALAAGFSRWLAAAAGGVDATAVDTLRTPAENAPTPPDKADDERVVESGTECAARQVDANDGCKKQSTAWALRQTGATLLILLAPAGLAVFGMYLIGCATYAARRRRAVDK